MHQAMLSAPTIRLRIGACERLREIFGCANDYEVAERIGIDPSQLSRIRRGRSDVGPNFMARVLLAVLAEGVESAELFEVLDIDGNRTPMTAVCRGGARRRSRADRPQRRAS